MRGAFTMRENERETQQGSDHFKTKSTKTYPVEQKMFELSLLHPEVMLCCRTNTQICYSPKSNPSRIGGRFSFTGRTANVANTHYQKTI